MIHSEPIHSNRQSFRQPQRLSNNLWLDPQQGGGDRIARSCILLVQKLGEDPEQFHVQLSQEGENGLVRRIPNQSWVPRQPSAGSPPTLPTGSSVWLTFIRLAEWAKTEYSLDIKPLGLRDPYGNEVAVSSWSGLLTETAEWFIREGSLTEAKCPVAVGLRDRRNPYLIHVEPVHPKRQNFRQAKRLSKWPVVEYPTWRREPCCEALYPNDSETWRRSGTVSRIAVSLTLYT